MDNEQGLSNEDKQVRKDGIRKIVDNFSSSTVEIIYSKEKYIERWLIVLLVVGFMLRLIASLNLGVLADDMVYASQSAGIFSAKILSTHSNPPLFFYLTDLSYKIFSYTTFASRFWALIPGTLLILLSFLITKKLFNRDIALFAAFFITFSSFLIRMTFTEMSLLVLFLCMLGVYFGQLFLESRKNKFLLLSALLFGPGVLTKYSAPFFIFAFLIYSLFYLRNNKEKIISKKNIYSLIIFIAIILVFAMPFLTFNYLLYKDKGITDVYFSRIIQTDKTQEFYAGLAGQERSFFDNALNFDSYGNISLVYHSDLMIFIFAIIGMTFLFKKKQYPQLTFILIFLIIIFLLQSPGSPLPKHFAFMHFIMAIPAGYGLNLLYKKINISYLRLTLIVFILLFMVINIGNGYNTPQFYLSQSATSELKGYVHNNIESDNLIVLDPRIYTSQALWISTPNHFLNIFQFIELYQYNLNLSNQAKNKVDVYFIECAKDDCGWGTIKDQPELNMTSESFFNELNKNSNPIKIIKSEIYSGNEFFADKVEQPEYIIYKEPIMINPQMIVNTDFLNEFYFVPYLYKDMSRYVFKYEITTLFDRILNKISYYILFISIIETIILFIGFILYCLNRCFKLI